jgi:hypothetical protein
VEIESRAGARVWVNFTRVDRYQVVE